MLHTVASLLIDGVAPFEFGVICEVFGLDRTDDGVPAFDFRVCGERPGESLPAGVGVRITPEHGLDAVDGADLVAVPACTIREEFPAAVLDVLRAAEARGATLLSVCTGGFVLGAAGLLDGRECTTHWRHVEEFAARFPAASVDGDVLFVDDGNVITSAGSAAGIDACLHLVRRELGSEAATAIARGMVVPPQRDGGQRQFVEMPVPECSGESLEPVLTWMLDNIRTEHTVAALARRAAMSERTFARRFVAETGTTPQRWLSTQRVLHARRLLEQTELSIDALARECGFGTPALLRHHFHRAVGVTPTDYRRTFACPAIRRPSVGGLLPARRRPEHPRYGKVRPVTSTASVILAENPSPMTLEGTNTWLLRGAGSESVIVVDPGPLDEGHLKLIAEHGPVAQILLTHRHLDHAEGARWLAELTGAPVRALDPSLVLGGEGLAEGDVVAAAGLELRVLSTPGHTSDSLCFVLPDAVLTGDTLLGRGTTVIDHPDGRLGDYLGSLSRLAELADGLAVLPGHGPELIDAGAVARQYLRHRARRLDQVREALRTLGVSAADATPRQVVELVYADVDQALWPAAEWSAQAQLAYLAS